MYSKTNCILPRPGSLDSLYASALTDFLPKLPSELDSPSPDKEENKEEEEEENAEMSDAQQATEPDKPIKPKNLSRE